MEFDKIKIGALFDLDGVIIDSEGSYTEFWREIERLYPTGIEDYAVAIKGTTLPEIMKNYSDEDVRRDILRRIVEFQDTMQYPLFPGVVDFLTELKENGIPAAIVTSSDSRKMKMLFQQHPSLQKYFQKVIDASMVTRSKPDPQGYLMGAGALRCDPENCYVFEDSLQGLKAARASGATVVGLATTYPRQRLEGLADDIIEGFTDFSVAKMLAIKTCR